VARRTDRSDGQLLLGPRHGAEDGAGRRAYESYVDLDPVGLPPTKRRFVDYPRRGRRAWTRWIPSWRLVLSLLLIAVAAMCAGVLVAYSRTQLPDQQNVDATFQTTIVYDTNHKELGRFSAQNRIWTPLNKIPTLVQDSVIAAEDRTFRTNQGVSFTGVVRAALNNVRGGARQGGSTITQQYVKNAYSSTTDRSVSRKINEFFVSIKAAQSLSKDEILERYLNIIYFGRGCYGVEAAAQCYFGKHVDKLTPSQAAYLAGIVNGPELYDSTTPAAKAAVRARWTYVLDGMAAMGSISPQQRAEAVFPKVLARNHQAKQAAGDQTEYLLGMIREEAKGYGISEQDLERGGYRISTTFDSEKIRAAERSLTDVLGPRDSWPKRTQAAIATIDPSNGQVVSVYSGNGDRDSNAVTQDITQAGSTFKPFALVAALEGDRDPGNCDPQKPGPDSLSLRSRVDGHSPQRFPGMKKPVTNFAGEHFGYVDLVTATAHSVNTAYVNLNRKVGPQHTMDVAVCAGYPAPGQNGTVGLDTGVLNVLGTSSPHPIDVASAFATFAAQGVHHDPYWIKSITKADKSVVVPERKSTGKRVFDEGVIADATYAMQSVVKQGTATYVRNLGRPVAGKTGTTTNNLSAWFTGFTPQYATVVVLYRLDRHGNPVKLQPWAGAGSEVTGGSLPARVWTAYMRDVLKGEPVKDFPEPVFGGRTLNAAPSPTATPSRTPSESSSSSSEPPSPTPTPTPTESEPEPSPTEPTPTPSATEPDPTPFPSPPGFPRPKPRPSPRP
jgi:membrane peptidoglycan carboxypeptidase